MRTRRAAGRGPAIEIALLNPNRYSEAAARRLRPWLEALLADLAPAGCRSLGVRFAGDRAMRQANRRFRGKDQTTDVLSFPGVGPGEGRAAAGSHPAGSGPAGRRAAVAGDPARSGGHASPAGDGHLGDVLISVPAARRQAAAAGRDPAREIRVLLLHGVLHCLGHDHEADGGEMERLERRLRRRWIGPGGGSQDGAGCDRPHPAGGPRLASPRPAGRARRGGRRAG